MDAFLDDMKEEDPDLLILSGDLTLDGEKASHEELAELLEGLSEAGIEVAVIPGNHDINNSGCPPLYGGWSGKGGVHHSGTSSGIFMLILAM
ncbi:MAG: metallophosphoesterase family protein [Clostridium fessum]